jgi:isoleucyl-tRNA synthetase
MFGYATLLAEDGREMHKSWGNSIEFNEAADTMGADTMRWLYAAASRNKTCSSATTRATRRAAASSSRCGMSILLCHLCQPGRLDAGDWYVRRSRRRFWKSEADSDKTAAYRTLYQVMVQFIQLLAPFIPFTTEAMYQNLVRRVDENAPLSVHHTLYPEADAGALDRRLLDKMGLAITTASLGRAARSSADIKLRQPLAKARINVGSQQAQDDLRSWPTCWPKRSTSRQLRWSRRWASW